MRSSARRDYCRLALSHLAYFSFPLHRSGLRLRITGMPCGKSFSMHLAQQLRSHAVGKVADGFLLHVGLGTHGHGRAFRYIPFLRPEEKTFPSLRAATV